jgi:hypothetical protein
LVSPQGIEPGDAWPAVDNEELARMFPGFTAERAAQGEAR